MTSSWVKGIIAMETHLPLFLYDLIQHAFKNMKAKLLLTCISARQTDISVQGGWTSQNDKKKRLPVVAHYYIKKIVSCKNRAHLHLSMLFFVGLI